MRPAIAFVMTFATVIHFTCGCCLHASHFGGDGACCHGADATCHADACCDGHGGDQAPPSMCVGCGEDVPDVAGVAADCAASDCGCAGCTCAATPTESEGDGAWPLEEAWGGDAFDTSTSASPRTEWRVWIRHRCPVPAALQPPLFERLLV